MIDILAKITELRHAHNWTDYQLAARAGIPQPSISNWYSKNQIPTIPSLEKVCRAFDMTLAEFFADDSDEVVPLNPDQKELLKYWSHLEKEQRDALLQVIKKMNLSAL